MRPAPPRWPCALWQMRRPPRPPYTAWAVTGKSTRGTRPQEARPATERAAREAPGERRPRAGRQKSPAPGESRSVRVRPTQREERPARSGEQRWYRGTVTRRLVRRRPVQQRPGGRDVVLIPAASFPPEVLFSHGHVLPNPARSPRRRRAWPAGGIRPDPHRPGRSDLVAVGGPAPSPFLRHPGRRGICHPTELTADWCPTCRP